MKIFFLSFFSVMQCNDSKQLWNSINMKGEIKPDMDDDVKADELAKFCSKKSRIDVSQTKFCDIKTNVVNEELDKDIDENEITEAMDVLNENSKTADGITPRVVKYLLPTIMNMLVIFFNLVFKGGVQAYPSNWINFINAIAKKGRLQLPKFVRFITIMGLFEKLYQTILGRRVYKFLKIPSQQTAYQKKKGCNLHVMTTRLLKALTVKIKQKLFIIFTDFEAAFDLVSRRILFMKLAGLGISAIMLNALISIYIQVSQLRNMKMSFLNMLCCQPV